MVILYFSLPKDPSILLARYTSAASLTIYWNNIGDSVKLPIGKRIPSEYISHICKTTLHSRFGTSFLRLPLKVYDGIICLSLIEILSHTHEPVTGQNFPVFVYCIKHHMYLKWHTHLYRTRDRFNITFFFLLDFI